MPSLLEKHSVEPIPADERHGTVRSLFTFWFAANAHVVIVTFGAIGIALGLSLLNTILAVVIGNVVGTVFMAYHSVQGPKLGLPQMIQSRAQFGFYGAIVPNVVVIVMYLGFLVLANVVAAQGAATLLGVSLPVAMTITVFLTWVLATLGYDALHKANVFVTVAGLILFCVLAVKAVQGLHTTTYVPSANTPANFFLMVTIIASAQITYSPYVSDYSRYLPAKIKAMPTFWATYLGCGLSAICFGTLGAIVGATALDAVDKDAIGYLAGLTPSIRPLVTVVLVAGLLIVNAENIYGPFVTVMALGAQRRDRTAPVVTRLVITAVIAVIGGVLAVDASENLLTNLEHFITVILYILIPWSAINLVDYYLIRKGTYDVDAIMSADGQYGKVSVMTLAVFCIGLAVQLPFVSTAWYVGPVANALGGVDIAWLVGFFAAGLCYYAANISRIRRPATQTVPATAVAEN